MKILVALVGLILVLEGLPYLAFPEAMQNWLRQLCEAKPSMLRIIGGIAVVAGLLLCYIARRTSLLG